MYTPGNFFVKITLHIKYLLYLVTAYEKRYVTFKIHTSTFLRNSLIFWIVIIMDPVTLFTFFFVWKFMGFFLFFWPSESQPYQELDGADETSAGVGALQLDDENEFPPMTLKTDS